MAYRVRTPEQDFFLAHFEKDGPAQSMLRGALRRTIYQAQWFDPRTGVRSKAGDGAVQANQWGWITVPPFPSDDDWRLKLTASTREP